MRESDDLGDPRQPDSPRTKREAIERKTRRKLVAPRLIFYNEAPGSLVACHIELNKLLYSTRASPIVSPERNDLDWGVIWW